uniref:ADP-ribosylation factor-like 13b n=1 Tax=Eptatretus burgeri TaxID=7764 RepID=A0A8C4WTI3_EPTBU
MYIYTTLKPSRKSHGTGLKKAAVNRNMCSLMSNYCCLLCPCQVRKKMTILILGLDNAGKTTLVKGLQKESTCDIAPTVGFSRADLHIDRFDVTMFDLGGSPNIRAIWQNYYADAHGAVFVVDSSDQSRIAEARDAVTGILMHPQIAGKPVLVLANKQDNERALCEADIIEHLSLEQLVNKNKCLCKIEKCSAVQVKGPKGEYCGLTSLRWLLATINGDHAKLHQRVLQDSAEQKQHQEAERKERYERVRLARLQREQVKGAEDLQHASFEQEEKDATNPFQPIKTVLTKVI